MIISVSRRTDIPAFYGEWFMNRIAEGYFYRINPFNTKQVKGYSLAVEDVDVLVFWTKNPKPFMRHIETLQKSGYRFYFQFTLNDYQRLLEPRIPPLEERISVFKELSSSIGRDRVIWRYDPIIVSSITPIEYHVDKIRVLSDRLKGYTNRLVISFMDFYGKVTNRLSKIASSNGITFEDIVNNNSNQLIDLALNIKRVVDNVGIQIFTCAEVADLNSVGI